MTDRDRERRGCSVWRRCWAAMALSALLGLHASASASPSAVEAFDEGRWAQIQASTRKPIWVVFTATWCANCPGVIEEMTRRAQRRKPRAEVWAIYIDADPGTQDARLIALPHLRQVHRLWAFDGVAPVIRHSVNPDWRGVVPYVGVLDGRSGVRWFTGLPPESAL